MPEKVNILGVTYQIIEVEVVNKEEPRKGEIDFLEGVIKIDKNMPQELKEQVLMHEILHAVCDLLGYKNLCFNEKKYKALQQHYTRFLSHRLSFPHRKERTTCR